MYQKLSRSLPIFNPYIPLQAESPKTVKAPPKAVVPPGHDKPTKVNPPKAPQDPYAAHKEGLTEAQNKERQAKLAKLKEKVCNT